MKAKPLNWFLRLISLLLVELQTLVTLPSFVWAQELTTPPPAPVESSDSAPVPVLESGDTVPTSNAAQADELAMQRVSVPQYEPLELKVRFSANPTDREFLEAPVFSQPLVPIGTSSPQENKALAKALLEYVNRVDVQDHSPLLGFLKSYPKSAWKPALLLNLGNAWQQGGFFSRAIAAWEEAWKLSKAETPLDAKVLADRALVQLVKMHSWVGRMDKLETLMAEAKDRKLIGGNREAMRTAYDSRWLAENRPDALLKCGPMALRQVLSSEQPNADPSFLFNKKPSREGFSLAQLKDLADESGLKYQMAKRAPGSFIPRNSIIHWKLNHYGVVSEDQGDKCLVLDASFRQLYDTPLCIRKEALEEESDGYFLIPGGDIPSGWEAVGAEEGQRVFGKGDSPRRNGNALTDKDAKSCSTQGGHPMAAYSAHLMLVSLNIVDTPVGYRPPVGLPVEFKVTYNQRDDESEANPAFSNLGAQWTSDWFTYIKDTGETGSHNEVTRYVSGGGKIKYTGYDAGTGKYSTDEWGNELRYIPSAKGDITTGLVGYWPMNEMADIVATDASGSGNSGTLVGASWCTGKIGSGALSFDGVNDYVQIGAKPNLVMTKSLTLSAWIYPTSPTGTIINKEGEYEIVLQSGRVKFALANTSPGWAISDTGFVPPVNQWSHITFVYDNGAVRFYANGTLFYSFSGSGDIGDVLTSQNDFRIGGRQSTAEYFAGRIDEVRMYNRALTATDVLELYKPADHTTGLVGYWSLNELTGSLAGDTSGSGNSGTLVGPSWCTGEVGGGALSFDGADDYVQIGAQLSLKMTSAFTMNAWIKPSSAGGTIVNKEGEYEIAIVGGTLRFALANASPGWVWVDSGFAPPVNQWSQVAVVYDSSLGLVRCYCNGTKVFESSGSGNIGDNNTYYNDFRIGGRQSLAQFFNGRIDEVSMYNRALSKEDIVALHDKPGYELTFPDGSKQVFRQPNVAGPTQNRKMFLSAQTDSAGNALQFVYEQPFRLQKVVDAIGQSTLLHYQFPGNSYKVTRVEDPFHRSALFDYDELGRLKKITDVISISSAFVYWAADPNFISQMTTPYGTSTFAYDEILDGNNQLMGDRWLMMTDPEGGTEMVHGANDIGMIGAGEVPPTEVNDFVNGQVGTQAGLLRYRNTLYFDKQAVEKYGKVLNTTDGLDSHWADAATVYHFLHDVPSSTEVESPILESIKPPGESRIWFYYPGQTDGLRVTGPDGRRETGITLRKPNMIVRRIENKDGNAQSQIITYDYDAYGRAKSYTDPIGRTTTVEYVNGTGPDVYRLRQGNDVVAEFGAYNYQHRPGTFKDAAVQNYTIAWNDYGQLTQITNPKSEVTKFAYSGGYLQNIQQVWESGTKTTSLGYDGFGRVGSVTSSDNYVLRYEYDAIDRPTKVIYPDTTFEQFDYSRLDLVRTVDRTGKATRMSYDSVGHLLSIMNRLGNGTTFSWCGCGGLHTLTDPLGRVTTWERDDSGRVTSKKYHDGKTFTYAYETLSGRLKSITDPTLRVKTYTYCMDDSLNSISYTPQGTPKVTFEYEDVYARLKKIIQDPASITSFSYYAVPNVGAGRLSSIDGPLNGDVDKVSYVYDQLGRVLNRTINGFVESVTYDKLGRITSHVTPIGTFTPAYFGDTRRLSQVRYPGNPYNTVAFSYLDVQGDFQLSQILNTTGAGTTISKFDYTYDSLRRIKTWTQQAGNGTPVVWTNSYDAEGQLIDVVVAQNQTITKDYAYEYDAMGNRTGEQVDSLTPTRVSTVGSLTYNAVNQLQSRLGSGSLPVHFKGTINEPGTVKVSLTGQPSSEVTAKMTQDATSPSNGKIFDANLTLAVGNNTVSVVATDVGTNSVTHQRNSATKNYSVTVAGAGDKSFVYDDNGNCTLAGTATYGWDGEDRLTLIVNGTKRTEFSYDGLGRRVKIVEKNNGVVTSDKNYVWCGVELAQELDALNNNSVTKQFFPEGQRNGGLYYYYTRDHLGSAREVFEWNGTVHARYDYDPYGRRGPNQITSNPVEADFGFTGHYFHSPSGLHLTLFRAYDADNGRWLNRDPVAEDGGLNLYGYVGNNPVNNIDPLGLSSLLNPQAAEMAAEIESGVFESQGMATQLAREAATRAAVQRAFQEAAAAELRQAAIKAGLAAGALVIMLPNGDMYSPPLPLPAGGKGPPGRPPCTTRSAPPFGPGDNEGAARGREAHKWWQPPPGFQPNFRFNTGEIADAVNLQTREILEMKTSAAEVAKGWAQIARYIKAAQGQFGGKWTGRVVDSSGQPW